MSVTLTNNIRRYDLDWLRIGVILMLIPFHAAVVFDPGGVFYFKNSDSSTFLAGFTDFLGAWGMQLLFFIAGASCYFMLKKYSVGHFLRERVWRLLVPLIVATVTIIPVMGYYGRLYHWGIRQSFWQYYPHFFEFNAELTGYNGYFSPGHLWFILFLFVLTLVALPLFAWFNRQRGQKVLNAIANFFSKPGVLFLVPIILLQTDGLPDLADRNFVSFFLLLVFGFIWMSSEKLQESTGRQRYIFLAAAVIAGTLFMFLQKWGELQEGPSLGATAYDLLHDTFTWMAIMTLVAFGRVLLNRPSKAVDYLSRASYPYYILHLPIEIAIMYYVIQWDAGVPLKFAVIVISSFALTFLVYDLIIRRVPFIRFLFGGKWRSGS